MHDNGLKLSRRKILAGLGGIGLASTGAGLGTTAYFSDRETYEGNQLVAGQLDLQVDWEEHYYDDATDLDDDRTDDFGGDEFETDHDGDGVDDFEIVRTGGDTGNVPAGYVGFPTFEEPVVAVPGAAMDDFLDNTAIEAMPDEDGDGIQDLIMTREQIATQNPSLSPEQVEEVFHDQFADVPDDLERPLIELDDVKPGDFGEVTFSTHLHNNPGYLWLTGELLEASENGLTEPERKDPDEEEGVVELLDEVQVAVWYDDGDNVREAEEMIQSPHDVEQSTNITLGPETSLITRGTLREVLETLGNGLGVQLDADPTTPGRTCYPNSNTYYFGFAWWLPVDHANEIQTDSVTFDLGFYTEQCRHNDGSGMAAEVASVRMPDSQNATVDENGTAIVHVDKTTLPDGGYVVLHSETGAVIGHSGYLGPGTHGNLDIEVTDAMTNIVDDDGDGNTTVVAMAHKDSNDNQVYDFPGDDGPYTINGNPVVDPGVVNAEGGS